MVFQLRFSLLSDLRITAVETIEAIVRIEHFQAGQTKKFPRLLWKGYLIKSNTLSQIGHTQTDKV